MKENEVPVKFSMLDMSYLLESKYDKAWKAEVLASDLVNLDRILADTTFMDGKTCRIEYRSDKHFIDIAKRLSLIPEWKDDTPRQGYYGVVKIRFHGGTLFIVPKPSLNTWKKLMSINTTKNA